MNIPFLDLHAQYEFIRDEINPAIQQVIDATAFAGGSFVEQFEHEFAAYCGTRHAVAVNSGTTALWIALAGLGVGPGDEVITVPNTFIATVEAIIFAGATPVFVDVEEGTLNMDPAQLERAITPATRAIMPVHLYGQMANMPAIHRIAEEHGLYVIEDAAQAHGATCNGQRAGTWGHAGCFSFYPGKNLGAYGEGGAVVTNDDGLAARMRVIRDHGQSRKYYHDVIGWNARMDGIQGAVLSTKLRHLDDWNAERNRHAQLYDELLEDVEGILPPVKAAYSGHVYHIYPIRLTERDRLMQFLNQEGIGCGIHYPVPVHLQKAFRNSGYQEGDFPVAELSALQELSLPMYAELSDEQIQRVCEAVRDFAGSQLDARSISRASRG